MIEYVEDPEGLPRVICVDCGERLAEPGRTRCQACEGEPVCEEGGETPP